MWPREVGECRFCSSAGFDSFEEQSCEARCASCKLRRESPHCCLIMHQVPVSLAPREGLGVGGVRGDEGMRVSNLPSWCSLRVMGMQSFTGEILPHGLSVTWAGINKSLHDRSLKGNSLKWNERWSRNYLYLAVTGVGVRHDVWNCLIRGRLFSLSTLHCSGEIRLVWAFVGCTVLCHGFPLSLCVCLWAEIT